MPLIQPSRPGFPFPGNGPKFARAVEGIPLARSFVFGTGATGSGTTVPITNATQLAAHFNPMQGVYSGSTHLGGTGPTTINSEPQRYNPSFAGSANHVFETDALRLQPVLTTGSFAPIVRGQVNTAGAGINVNAAGAASPTTTAIADIGLTQEQLDTIPVGAVCNNGPSGLAWVRAKATGTITLEAISGGARTAYTGNWHMTFMPWHFARVSAAVTNGTSTALTFATSVSSALVGMVAYGAGSTSYVDPKCKATAKVTSVSGSTVNFDVAVNFDTFTATNANSGGVLFLPDLSSGQIWTKQGFGPHLAGNRVMALEAEIQQPAQGHFGWGGTGSYTKTQVEATLAANSTVLWGCWPSVWGYWFREGNVTIDGGRTPWSEIDVWEGFHHINRGPAVWTGNLHDQAYTRRTSLGDSASLARNGWTWLTSAATNKALTPNATELQAPSGEGLGNGSVRTVGIVWTRDRVVHYIDGIPICDSQWSMDSDYPMQWGVNLAMGALSSGNPANLFFPLANASVASSHLKIKRLSIWQG